MKYFAETSRYGDEWERRGEYSSLADALDSAGEWIEDWYKYTFRVIDEQGFIHHHLIEMGDPIDVAKSEEVFEEIRNGYGFTVDEFTNLCKQWLVAPHVDED